IPSRNESRFASRASAILLRMSMSPFPMWSTDHTSTAPTGDTRRSRLDSCLLVLLNQADEIIGVMLEGVVVADDDELLEATHLADLVGEIVSPFAVHVLGGLVEEGEVDLTHLFQQGQADGEGGAHLLTAGELDECPRLGAALHHDLVVLIPAQLGRMVVHDLF